MRQLNRRSPVNDVDDGVVLRLTLLELVNSRPKIFFDLHPLRQTKRQFVVLELERLQVELVLVEEKKDKLVSK